MRRLVGGIGFVHRMFAVGVVGLLLLAGCGGSSKADDAGADQAKAGEVRETSTTSTTAAAKTGSAKPKAQAAATTTTTTTAAQKSAGAPQGQTNPSIGGDESDRLVITAEVKEACVRPGGSQTITIRARLASGVGYDSVYSDGKSGMMEGHYGGNFGGIVDDTGTWKHTWTVGPNAPAGPVLVRVLGTHEDDGMGQTEAHFSVANALGKCS